MGNQCEAPPPKTISDTTRAIETTTANDTATEKPHSETATHSKAATNTVFGTAEALTSGPTETRNTKASTTEEKGMAPVECTTQTGRCTRETGTIIFEAAPVCTDIRTKMFTTEIGRTILGTVS